MRYVWEEQCGQTTTDVTRVIGGSRRTGGGTSGATSRPIVAASGAQRGKATHRAREARVPGFHLEKGARNNASVEKSSKKGVIPGWGPDFEVARVIMLEERRDASKICMTKQFGSTAHPESKFTLFPIAIPRCSQARVAIA
jgi:O-glycosyl hydrolase